jgi:hypothetical protein
MTREAWANLVIAFRRTVQDAEALRRRARQLSEMAGRMEADATRAAGLEHVDRGPGFPGWRHKDDPDGRHYDTPEEALEAAGRIAGEAAPPR